MFSWLKPLDILNILPTFYIQNREKFSSSLGILVGISTIIYSIGVFIFFVFEYFQKDEANIVFNEISSFEPSLNMTNVPFIFKLTNPRGDLYSDRIITFNFQHWTFEKLSNGTPKITTLDYERCNKTKHFQNYEKFFYPIYDQMKIDTYYCLNLDNYDLTINGLFGDLINGYSLINLYINECANNTRTNKTDCLPKEDLMKLIGDTNMFLRVSYIDFQIDHKNYTNPYYPYVRSENIQFSYKAKARVYYYLKNVIYKTDVGYFQQQMEQESFFQYDYFLLTYPSVTYQIPNAFGLFSFLISSKASQFNRSFPKIQSLIANISGIINGSMFLIKLFLHFFSKESIFLFYFNEIINPKSDSAKRNSNNNLKEYRESKIMMISKIINKEKSKAENFNENYNNNIIIKKSNKDSEKHGNPINFLQKKNTEILVKNNTKVKLKKSSSLRKENEISNLNLRSSELLNANNNLKSSNNDLIRNEENKLTYLNSSNLAKKENEVLTESNLVKILKGRSNDCKSGNKFSLGIFYLIFKCFGKQERKVKYYLKSKSYIIEKLSVENILKTLVNFDVFKKAILNENQLRMINYIPKQTLKRLRNIDSNNFKNYTANVPKPDYLDLDKDEVSRKLLEFYKI